MPTFRVGKPRIRLELTGNTALTAGSSWSIPWSSVAYEDPAIFDPLTPTIYTISKTGLYLITLNIVATTIGSTARIAKILVDGVTRAHHGPSRTTAGLQGNEVSTVDELDAGAQVVGQLSTLDSVTPTLQQVGTSLTITRVGPERWTG